MTTVLPSMKAADASGRRYAAFVLALLFPTSIMLHLALTRRLPRGGAR